MGGWAASPVQHYIHTTPKGLLFHTWLPGALLKGHLSGPVYHLSASSSPQRSPRNQRAWSSAELGNAKPQCTLWSHVEGWAQSGMCLPAQLGMHCKAAH